MSARQSYYEEIAGLQLGPLWESLHTLVPKEPAANCQPHFWRYEAVRPQLMRAGSLITAAEAVRRVPVLENPALAGTASITQSLYAGLQLIMPGEIAPSHRHTQSALRFIVEGSSAWTAMRELFLVGAVPVFMAALAALTSACRAAPAAPANAS
jgi:gentisate 1,2-dioxygenase